MTFLTELWVGIGYGVLTLIGYGLWKRFPPKDVNWWYGYRTATSMRNADTWQEANTYASSLLLPIGLLTILFSIIWYLLFPPEVLIVTPGSVFLVVALVVMVGLTEWHLHRTFDKDGQRKR